MKTALKMNDPHFAMSIYEEAGDVYFKGHRNQIASLPFYRVRKSDLWSEKSQACFILTHLFICGFRMAAWHLHEASRTSIQSSVC